MKNYLITGGAGFIGSRIAAQLLNEGNEVLVIDNLRTGFEPNIPDGSDFVKIDIRDFTALSRLNGYHFDAVLHLAAQSSGEISHDDPDYDLDTNARGTLNVLRWSYERGIDRVLNASSMGVYGEVPESSCPVKEDMPLRPLSFYGVSKLAAENYCNYFMSKGMKITSFRMFNVYGPGQNLHNMKQGMVSIYMKYIIDNKPVTVKGNKDRFRDLIYIDDVAEAWIKAIDNTTMYNKSYNLGTGARTYVFQIVEALLKAFGKDLTTYPVHYVGSTPADQFGIYSDITKLRTDAGWEPKFSVDSGFSELAAQYASMEGADIG